MLKPTNPNGVVFNMSTKIYNDFVLPSSITHKNIHTVLYKLKQSMQEVADRKYKFDVINDIYKIVDNYVLDIYNDKEDNLEYGEKNISDISYQINRSVYSGYLASAVSKTHSESDYPDVKSELLIYFNTSKPYLAKLISNDSDLTDKFYTLSETLGIKDYHYQNQSDKPDDVSYRQWKRRIERWDEAIGETGVFSTNALSYTLSQTPNILVDSSDIINLVDSPSKRAYNIAKLSLQRAFVFKKQGNEKIKFSDFIEILNESDEYLRSDEGKQELNNLQIDISSKLVTITEDNFYKKLKYLVCNKEG